MLANHDQLFAMYPWKTRHGIAKSKHALVIDLDTESEKENETKNNQEKEFSVLDLKAKELFVNT